MARSSTSAGLSRIDTASVILPSGPPRSYRGSPPAHDPAAAQMSQQFFFEDTSRLNEQALVDRLVRDGHGRVSGIPNPQQPGDLLRRPLARQLSGDQIAQSMVECQPARLGAKGTTQCPFFSPSVAIHTASTVTPRRSCPPQTTADPAEGEAFSKTTRYLLALHQAERSRFACSGRRGKAPFAATTPNTETACLPRPGQYQLAFRRPSKLPEFGLLFMRQARATGSRHRGSFQNISVQKYSVDQLNPPSPS